MGSMKPKCRICEAEHWPREPHIWPKETREQCAECVRLRAENAALRNQLVTMERNQSVTKRNQPVTNVTSVTNGPKRDRAEYMRKRRAEQKERVHG